MKRHHSPLDYAFAVGRIRALENYLIPMQVFREALSAETTERALEIISDAGKYGEELLSAKTPEALDRVLKKERMALDFTLQELFLEKEHFAVYRAMDSLRQVPDLLSSLENPFLKEYLQKKIDLANLKIFLRGRYLEQSVSYLEENFIAGGKLEKKFFLEHLETPLEEVASALRTYSYAEVWKAGVSFLLSRESFVVFERETENLLMNFLKVAKQITFGPEPLFAYGQAKKQELKMVRLVLAGKMLAVPETLVKERITQTYV
ncbi:MAG: V-type ATPase subunit [Candidatus Aminicenantes bacterium]|nr:V-type ATPase subunit [Candidatus Aminicenantes bacterium]